jgi:NitT/TauT family transport system substrate-binding protein
MRRFELAGECGSVLRGLLLAGVLALAAGCSQPAPSASPVATAAPAPLTAAPPPPTAVAPTTATATSVPTTAAAYHPTPLNPPVHVKVTDDQVTSMVAIYLAYDRGYFTDEGLDVELQVSNDRSQDVALLATNQAQFIVSLPDPVLFNAIARGIDIRILASATVNGPTDRPATFLVRTDLLDSGQYKSPADARGLSVAVGAPSSTFYVDTYLSRAGLGIDDVKVVNLTGPEAIAAFRTRAIDAAWEAEPIATSLNVQGLARTVATTGELVPGSVAGALAVAPQFAHDQPEATQRFVNAFLRGARDYYYGYSQAAQAERAPIVQTLVSHTTVKDLSLYSQIGLPSYDPNCSTDPSSSWGAFQDFYVKRGIEERKVDISKYVDYGLINHALELLGRV